MANNRELSQFGSFINVDDTTRNVGIATTVRITAGGLFVGAVQAIRADGTWGGSSAGIQGAQGTNGTQGTTGAQGTTGTQGIQGITGAQGATGSQGTTGAQGATGTQGTTGGTGAQGATGPTGGSNTQILYNSGGTATGSANMTFDGTRPTFATLRTDNILPTGGLPAGATGGGIIQCVQAIKTDTEFFNGNGGTRPVTGLSVNITPRSTSNKVLVIVQLSAGTNNNQPGVLLYRNGSVTSFIGNAASNRGRVAVGIPYLASSVIAPATFTYIDSPGSTSQQTYTVYVTTDGNSSVYVNYTVSDTDISAYLRVASSITAMEVSA